VVAPGLFADVVGEGCPEQLRQPPEVVGVQLSEGQVFGRGGVALPFTGTVCEAAASGVVG
jgi:hypothetical protein